MPVWEVKLNKKITAVVGKSPLEKVHSPGRVLGDRSVLYKYINPNLVAVITQVEDPIHKSKSTHHYFVNRYSTQQILVKVKRVRGTRQCSCSCHWSKTL